MYHTLEQLGSNVKAIWTEYLIVAKVFNKLTVTSSTGNNYEHVLVGDNTGSRIFYNCNNLDIELEKNYTFKIRASLNERNNTITSFILEVTELYTNESFRGEPSLEERIVNMVYPQLYLTLIEISEVAPSEAYFNEEVDNSSFLLKLKDSEDRSYFYRIWPQDPDLQKEDLTPNSILKFVNITIFKKDSSNNVSLTRNRFSAVSVETDQ